MPTHWKIIGAILGGLALLGCVLSIPGNSDPLARALPRVTATPIPTIPRPPTSAPHYCPPARAVDVPPAPATFAAYPAAVARYLDAGAPPSSLPALLAAWDARASSGDFSDALWLTGDLTGDAVPEIAVVLADPGSDETALALYTCRHGEVHPLYTYRPGPRYRLHLIALADLTTDGVAELLFAEVSCGEATCWHEIRAWAWADVDFVERMSDRATYPDPTYTVDAGRLLVGKTMSETWYTGPQRPHTTTLAWDGAAIAPAATLIGPARYRVHALFDGDAALSRGENDAARAAYTRVLADETLDAWIALFTSEEERRWLTALAHWRLLTLDAVQGNAGAAQARYAQLQSEFAAVTAGYPVARLAQDFWRSYQRQHNLVYGCAAAVQSEHARDVVDFLNSYGDANPTYTVEMLCPF